MAEADNLKIAQELNKLISDRRALLSAQTREMQSQLQIALQMKAVMDGMSADELTRRLGEAQTALDEIAQKAQDVGHTSSEAMASLGKGADKATSSTSKLEKQTKLLLARYPALKTVGAAALSGMTQGFTNLLSLTKGVAGVVEGLVSMTFNLGKAILSIPIRIFQGLLDDAAGFGGDNSLMQAFENLRKEFGSFREDVSKNVITAFHDVGKGITGTGLSAFRVLGTWAEQLEYFTKQAVAAGAQIHKFGEEIAHNSGAFVAYQKGLGVNEKNLKSFMDRAVIAGTSLSEQFRKTANYSLQMGKTFGISQKVLAKDIGDMMKDVKNFGSLTQKEMSVAAVYTRKLGIEVKDLLGLIDKFDTFEDAANSAAQLSQAFGTSVDAFKLMQEQDPAKRLDMLRKSMLAAGKSTENMSRQELKLLAQTSGLSEESAKLAFSKKNEGVAYDKIQKKAGEAEKSQISQAEALARLADSIERVVKSGSAMKGGFFDMFIEGVKAGIKWTAEYRKLMMNLRVDLWQTRMAGMQVGKAFVDSFPGIKDMLGGLAELFNPARFQKLLNGIVKSFTEFFKDMDSGKWSLKKLLESLQKNFFNWFDTGSSDGKRLLEGAQKTLKAFGGIIGQGIAYVVEMLTKGISKIADFIKDPSAFFAKAKEGGKGAMGILQPLIEPLSDPKLWKGLFDSIKKLLGVIMDRVVEFMHSDEFKSIAKKIGPAIAAVLFGPAIVRILAATLIQSIVKMFSGGATGIAKAITGGGAKVAEAAAKAEGAASKAAGAGDALAKGSPDQKMLGAVGSTIQGLAKIKTGDIVKAGSKGFLLSIFIGGALIALISSIGIAAKVLQTLDVDTKSFIETLGAVAMIALATIPIMFALKLASKMAIGQVLKGLLAIGTVVAAMGAALVIITGVFSLLGLSPADAKNISESMAMMGLVFAAAGLIVPIALAVGAMIANPYVAAAAAIGLVAMVSVIEAMTVTVIGIMAQIDRIPLGAGIGEKVKAFAEIMKAVGSFAGNIAQLMEATRPSFFELIAGKGDTLANMKELHQFINEFIGRPGQAGGITGLLDVIMEHVRELHASPEMLKAAEMFAQVLSAAATLAQAIVPSPEAKSTFDSILNVIRGESSDTQLQDITNYVVRLVDRGLEPLLKTVSGVIEKLGSVKISEEGLKLVTAFGSTLGAIAGAMKAITPSPEMMKSLQTSVKQSAAWGLIDTTVSATNTQGLASLGTFFTELFKSAGPLIETLTGSVLSSVLEKAKDLKKDDFDKIKIVIDIIGNVAKLLQGFSQISQNIPASTLTQVGEGTVTVLSSVASTFGAIVKAVKDNIGGIIENVLDVAKSIKVKDVGPQMDVLKKVFDVIGSLSTSLKTFIEFGSSGQDTAGIDPKSIIDKIVNIGKFVGDLFSSSGPKPIQSLIQTINEALGTGDKYALSGETKQGVSSLATVGGDLDKLFKAVGTFKDSAEGVQAKLEAILSSNVFSKSSAAEFFAGTKTYFSDMNKLSVDVGEMSVKPAINATKQIIDSVNELNKILNTGEAAKIPLSVSLKKFVDNSGLGSNRNFSIVNKGVTIFVNMEVKMSAEEMEDAIVLRTSSIIKDGIKDSKGLSDFERGKLAPYLGGG